MVQGIDGGAHYVMRVLPYRTVADVISGVVITFVDVTRITAAEARIEELTNSLRERVASLETVLDLVPVGVFIMSGDRPDQASLNRAAGRLLGGDDNAQAPRLLSSDLPLHREGAELPRASQPLRRAAHTREPVPAFEAQLQRADGTSIDVLVTATPLVGAPDKAQGAIAAMVDITERRQAEMHQQLLLHEVQHRAKNILATVTALARRAGTASETGESSVAALVDRLQAMARTHELLSRDVWRGARLDDLLRVTLAPYLHARSEAITIGGPPVQLDPRASSVLGMVLHELASNAVQFGAMGSDKGRLAITWSLSTREGRRWLSLSWKETLDRPVRPPAARGFGTAFIERSLSYELAGAASIAFEPDGIVCVLEFPLDQPDGS
jgi:two-component system CheB/CheR fusion protein